MEEKIIFLDPAKCTGCRDCEVACSIKHTGLNDPALSCVRVISENNIRDFYLPLICLQCSEAPCLAACPREAIYRDNDLNRVMIDHRRCIGCKMCVAACPIGAMGFDEDRGHSFKCDLCGGDPQCVRCCEPKALAYVDANLFQLRRMRASAEKSREAMGHRAA